MFIVIPMLALCTALFIHAGVAMPAALTALILLSIITVILFVMVELTVENELRQPN